MAKVFGKPLDKLIEQDRRNNPSLQIPQIVIECLRYITRNGLDNEGIFRISGNKDTIQQYQTCFDKGEYMDFVKDKSNPSDVASLLKQFLRLLPDPLLTFQFYSKWIQLHDISNHLEQIQQVKNLVEQLPIHNRVLLTVLIGFFCKVAGNSSLNKMDSGNISKTVGPNMLWKEGKSDSIEYLVNSTKINDLIKLMIDEYKDIFLETFEMGQKWAIFDGKYYGHNKSIQSLAVDSKFNYVWSCDSQGLIRIWSTSTYKTLKEFDSGQGRIFTLSSSNDSIWSCSQSCTKIWDPTNGNLIHQIDIFAYCAISVNDRIWIGSESNIIIFDKKFQQVSTISVPSNVVMTLFWDDQNNCVWGSTTSRLNFITIWDATSGKVLKEINTGHKRKVNAFQKCPNKLIWTASDDSKICIWQYQGYNSDGELNISLVKKLDGHQGAIHGLTVFGDYMWSCGWDATVRIWSVSTQECVCVITDHQSDCISNVVILRNPSHNKHEAWTSSWDRSICTYIINYHTNEVIPKSESISELSKRVSAIQLNLSMSGDEEGLTKLFQKKEDLALRKKMLAERRLELDLRKDELNNRRKVLNSQLEKLEKEISQS